MPTIPSEPLIAAWWQMQQNELAQTLHWVQLLAHKHCDSLATHFYSEMLRDAEASRLLNHEQVRTRLHASMTRWVQSVLSVHERADLEAVVAQQIHVGQVHARLDVPVHLVLRGARSLKNAFVQHVYEHADPHFGASERLAAMHWAATVVDFCMEMMGHAYHRSHDRSSRAQEAYRLHAVAYNLGAERERQRAALLGWENQLMFDQAMGLSVEQLSRLGSSEFGLWFRHKGAHAFLGTPECQLILDAIDRVDQVLLPGFGGASAMQTRLDCLRQLREQMRATAMHLDSLFEQSREIDAGRDVLTQLLNRKFLPVVLGKEITYCRERHSNFAVLAIDADHFKQVNDTYGHAGGDAVLQQLAQMLSDACRSGDYTFRLGGEEFLVLLVDVSRAQALSMAQRLNAQVAAKDLRLPGDRLARISISVGVAMHDGHPDYQYTLRQADAALYTAKNQGRNRVVLAD